MRSLVGLVHSRGSMKKSLFLLLLPAALLVYISLEASRSLLYRPPASGSYPTDSGRHFGERKAPVTEGMGKIILMTYGRSGSTLTSEIIQRDRDVFYTFEPLHNLKKRVFSKNYKKMPMLYTNETDKAPFYERDSVQLMSIFLTCSFESLDPYDINNFQLRNSVDSRLLWQCVQRASNSTPADAVRCFLDTRKVCLKRRFKMVKTIRLAGSAARKLMDVHDDLKLLYLVRDPRGTLNSQKKVFSAFKWEEIGNFSKRYCNTFKADLLAVGEMMSVFPGRVKIVRYETLAQNPLAMSKELYQFLGLNYTKEVSDFVFNKTMAGQRSKNPYGTSRRNSSETATAWRKKMTLASVQTVDRNCEYVYRTLGYRPVHSLKELMDPGLTMHTPVVYHGMNV